MGTIFEPLQATWSKRVNELVARAVVVCDDMHRHWKIYIESIISIVTGDNPRLPQLSILKRSLHSIGTSMVSSMRSGLAELGREMTRAPYKTNQAIVRDFMAKNCKFCLEKQGTFDFVHRIQSSLWGKRLTRDRQRLFCIQTGMA